MPYRQALIRTARLMTRLVPTSSKRRIKRLLQDPDEFLLRPEHFPGAIGLSNEPSVGLKYVDGRSPIHPGSQPHPDVAGCVQMIRNASLHELKNPEFLEHELLPRLGLNNENFDEFPAHLSKYSGYGLKIWQYPTQLARYLADLATKRIGSYMELGVRHGGTFILTVEYLSRFGKLESAVAVDLVESPNLRSYAEGTPSVTYIVDSSTSERVKATIECRKWDLVLIDGDHTFLGCLHDYIAARNNARLVVLHDIVSDSCPGVQGVWQLASNMVPKQLVSVYTDQYCEVFNRTGRHFLGIGLIDFSQLQS
jgi:cephalosporin hydroxylase